ncbi:hypothetical protein ACJRO7_007936 [Eucalyptus globulus]|uniref:Uncharacterized protein n=1 Tax=Eucalyptus globulus TaxID=34317 RepID=A0ABD3IPU9_EUCGL
MAPRNPGGDLKAPPPLLSMLPSVAFPPEASAPPVYMGTPILNIPGINVGVWTTGLFGLITCFCSWITFGQNAEIIDKGTCACAGALCCLIFDLFYCSFWYTCTYQTKLRGLYLIAGDQCGDCCVHLWCEPCAFCQEHRELKYHGFNPSIATKPPNDPAS